MIFQVTVIEEMFQLSLAWCPYARLGSQILQYLFVWPKMYISGFAIT